MVPPSSDRISRVLPYSGYRSSLNVFAYGTLTLFGVLSHTLRLTSQVLNAVLTPGILLLPVCPLPRSLATTYGISFDFSSLPYLDVSVQAVPPIYLCIQYMVHGHDSMWVSPFRHLRINGCLLLPVTFRSLPRLSSAPSAKAFALRLNSLDRFPKIRF